MVEHLFWYDHNKGRLPCLIVAEAVTVNIDLDQLGDHATTVSSTAG